MKLVNAEYEHPEGRLTTWGARVHFLELIEELAPHVLDDLATEPFQLFERTGIGKLELLGKEIFSKRHYRDIGTFWRSIESGRCNCDYYVDFSRDGLIGLREEFLHEDCQIQTEANWDSLKDAGTVRKFDRILITKYEHYPKCPIFVRLHESLHAWKKRHGLMEMSGKSWCLESAFYSLDHWARSARSFKEIGLSTFGTSEHSPYLKSIDHPRGLWEWQPEYEERSAYIESQLKRVREDIEAGSLLENPRILRKYLSIVQIAAEEYCDEVEKHYRAAGWEKIRDRKEIRKHLSWAVRFQVNKETFSSIAKSEEVSVPAVKKAIEHVLELIGIQKREDSKRGRVLGQGESVRSKTLRQLGL
jgi:hypothetical protein